MANASIDTVVPNRGFGGSDTQTWQRVRFWWAKAKFAIVFVAGAIGFVASIVVILNAIDSSSDRTDERIDNVSNNLGERIEALGTELGERIDRNTERIDKMLEITDDVAVLGARIDYAERDIARIHDHRVPD